MREQIKENSRQEPIYTGLETTRIELFGDSPDAPSQMKR